MFPLDHFDGSFELDVVTGSDEQGVYARAMGREVRHPFDLQQAVQDLNVEIYDAVSRGEIIPSMDN